MTHPLALPELTAHELTSVTGGFLPMLGLLGMGINLASSFMSSANQSSAPAAQPAAPSPAAPSQPAAPPTSAGNLLAQPAPVQSSGGCCCGCCRCCRSGSSASSSAS